MPGQSGFLPPRDLFLTEELEAATSGSGQLRVVAGRRESLEPTTLAVFVPRVTGRVFPRADAGGLLPALLGSQPRRRPRRLVSARFKEEVAGAGSRAS